MRHLSLTLTVYLLGNCAIAVASVILAVVCAEVSILYFLRTQGGFGACDGGDTHCTCWWSACVLRSYEAYLAFDTVMKSLSSIVCVSLAVRTIVYYRTLSRLRPTGVISWEDVRLWLECAVETLLALVHAPPLVLSSTTVSMSSSVGLPVDYEVVYVAALLSLLRLGWLLRLLPAVQFRHGGTRILARLNNVDLNVQCALKIMVHQKPLLAVIGAYVMLLCVGALALPAVAVAVARRRED